MNIVFMGTPDLAAVILKKLAAEHTISAVYTRPDAVRGRGKALVASPVKQVAQELDLPVFTPKSLRSAEVIEHIKSCKPDVICVAAYGAILPVEVLEIPRLECLNVHGSLLPRWRGAAPIERSILAGDEKTGVCIMRMEEGLDTGAYCVVRSLAIQDLSADELTLRLADLGAEALLEALSILEEQGSEALNWLDQDEAFVTYAEKIAKSELFLNPADSCIENLRRAQASSKAHPSRCGIAGKQVSVWKLAQLTEDDRALCAHMQPGDVQLIQKRLFLGCSDGVLELLSVQPQGKQCMDAKSFAAGIQQIKTPGKRWEVVDHA